jgi:hypothetical protein
MTDDELDRALESPDLETRVGAIERAAHDPTKYAHRVAALIPRFPDEAYFVLERVHRFGSAIVPSLVELAKSTPSDLIRLLATLGLAKLRQPVDTEILFRAIRERSDYQYLACVAFIWLGDKGALPELLSELHKTSAASDWDRTVSLINSIETLGGSIPRSERDRLIAGGPPLTRKMLDAKRNG